MESPALLLLLSAGKVEMFGVDGHQVKSRVLPTLRDMEENDLLMSDEQVMEVVKPDDRRVKVSHATMMCGLVATSSMKTMGLVLAAAMMTTGADAQGEGRKDAAGGDDYTGVYMMMFVTVILAIFAEKIITRLMNYGRDYNAEFRAQNDVVIPGIYAQQAAMLPAPTVDPAMTRRRKRQSSEEGEADDMEVDELYGMNEEQLRKQLVCLRVDLEREQYINKKMLEQHTEDKNELMDKIHTLRNKTGENDEYTKILAKHKMEFKEKFEEADKKYKEYYDLYKEYYDKYGNAKAHAASSEDTTRMLQGKLTRTQDELADVKNSIVDWQNKYEDVKQDLIKAMQKEGSRRRKRSDSQSPMDDRDSRDGSREREEQPEVPTVEELQEKLDEMKEKLQEKIDELKDLEKKMEDQKKDMQEKEVRYTMMMNDYGNVIQQKDEKINELTLETNRLRQRCQNYDERNAELQRNLNTARAPENVFFCRHGECYHGPNCNHVKDKQVNFLRKCKDCLP